MAGTRAEDNRGRTDGIYCHRCGERLDEAKTRWLVLSCADGRFYTTDAEADEAFEIAARVYRGYATYRERASHRVIRVFVLEPAD